MTDVYSMIQSKILAELAKGKIPWAKPWKASDMATSYVTKKPYSFINQLLLGGTGEWITFNQCTNLGGYVRKGAKSQYVVFWKLLKTTEKVDDKEVVKTIPILRYYNVFNIEDCEGIKPHNLPVNEFEEEITAEDVINNYRTRENISISYGGDKAYYSPDMDAIHLPIKEAFANSNAYYSTTFHEMTHSTGAEKRLNRSIKNLFGTSDYAKEELIAEMGSAYLMGNLGLDSTATIQNSAAYIQAWSKAIKEDKYLVVSACGKAEKACKYILGIKDEECTGED